MMWYMIRYDMTTYDIWHDIRYDMRKFEMVCDKMRYDMISYNIIWYKVKWCNVMWYCTIGRGERKHALVKVGDIAGVRLRVTVNHIYNILYVWRIRFFKRGYYVGCLKVVLTVVSTKPAVFWHLTPLDLVDRRQNFGETRHFQFYSIQGKQFWKHWKLNITNLFRLRTYNDM
jgi:hypothetical protein